MRTLLRIPDNLRVVALMALGYPRVRPDIGAKILHFVRRRKSMKKIVSLDEYGKSPEL